MWYNIKYLIFEIDIELSFDESIINFYIYINIFVIEKFNVIMIYINMLGYFLMILYNLYI